MDEQGRANGGFTLIELIVVMIIIGILVLLAAPRFLNYVEEARYTRIINDTKVMEDVMLADMARNNKLPMEEETSIVNHNRLVKDINAKRGYVKEGQLNILDGDLKKSKSYPNFSDRYKRTDPAAGYMVDIDDEDFEKIGSFYKIPADFVKRHTSTRLKGTFLTNKDALVVYVGSDVMSDDEHYIPYDESIFTAERMNYMGSEDKLVITGIKEGKLSIVNNEDYVMEIPNRLEYYEYDEDGEKLEKKVDRVYAIHNNRGNDGGGNFDKCKLIKNIDFSQAKSLEIIGGRSFQNFKGLENLDFGGAVNLRTISDAVFTGSKIVNLEFSNNPSLKTIESGTFADIETLESIDLTGAPNLGMLHEGVFRLRDSDEDRLKFVDMSGNENIYYMFPGVFGRRIENSLRNNILRLGLPENKDVVDKVSKCFVTYGHNFKKAHDGKGIYERPDTSANAEWSKVE